VAEQWGKAIQIGRCRSPKGRADIKPFVLGKKLKYGTRGRAQKLTAGNHGKGVAARAGKPAGCLCSSLASSMAIAATSSGIWSRGGTENTGRGYGLDTSQ